MNLTRFFALSITIILCLANESGLAYLNTVNKNHSSINSILPTREISGTVLSDNSITDFVGVNFIGLNQEGQPGIINGNPAVWIYDGRFWRSVSLSEVSLITYNKFENINGRCNISVTVSLKDGNSYDYHISPAKTNIIILIKSGSDKIMEKSIQVFNTRELVLSGILFN